MLHFKHQFTPYETPRLSDQHDPFTRVLGVHANGHDASISIVENGDLVEIIEFERVFREKHCRWNVLHERYENYIDWAFGEYGLGRDIDAVALHLHYFGSEPREYHELVQEKAVSALRRKLPNAHYLQLNHHLCHAASGYFTSPFDEAIVLSIDGHGNDGSSLGFHARGNEIKYVRGWPFSLGRAYSALGNIIGGIYSKDGNAAGKVMGLTAYGTIIEDWKPAIRKFIKLYTGIRSEASPLFWEASVADGVFALPGHGVITGRDDFEGPEDVAAQNFATTFQAVWSEVVQEMVREMVSLTGVNKICLVGGCALNATTNYDILNMSEISSAHFVPFPNDEGLSAGAALYTFYSYQNETWTARKNGVVSPYLGVPILDIDELDKYAAARNKEPAKISAESLAKLIAAGKKVGLMQGNSEAGPRALGNRSILADPRNADIKDIINEQIKGREWFRPFAPVVRKGEQDRYFEMAGESPYMSIIAPVREEWKSQLPGITHADGTARVQTVDKELNPFLWELLGWFEQQTGVGVLLNTSFNGRGQPIYARIREALELLDTTNLDALYVNGYLFE